MYIIKIKITMKKLLFILLSALSLTAFAQQKKVAVYVTGQQTGINKVLGDQLVSAFAKSGKYIAIERTASFLAELGKEQNYQRTGAVGDNEIARLGEQFGVQLVCVADVSEVFGEKYVSARLIDVESAEVVNSSNASSPMNSMNDLLSVTNKITQELTSKTNQEKAAETAALQKAKEEEEQMLLDGFAKGYIKCGDLYAVISYSKVRYCGFECPNLGGRKDWRAANTSELNVVKQACRNYYANKDNYTKIPSVHMEQLKKIFDGDSFWVNLSHNNGPFYNYINSKGEQVECYGQDCRSYTTAGIMYVCDAK
jgi:hypothetical protein